MHISKSPSHLHLIKDEKDNGKKRWNIKVYRIHSIVIGIVVRFISSHSTIILLQQFSKRMLFDETNSS